MSCVKNLSLIQAIVLLHDCSPPKPKSECDYCDFEQFEHTRENIDLAYKLAQEILGRTLIQDVDSASCKSKAK